MLDGRITSPFFHSSSSLPPVRRPFRLTLWDQIIEKEEELLGFQAILLSYYLKLSAWKSESLPVIMAS